MDSCDVIFYNISNGLEAMDELRFTLDDNPTHYDRPTFKMPDYARAFEKYRWPATYALLCK